jgi:DNA-directed RNA polymerase subunit RPC12/RpoP
MELPGEQEIFLARRLPTDFHGRTSEGFSMSIKFRCGQCGHMLKADLAMIGHQVRCTRCPAVLTVPRPETTTIDMQQMQGPASQPPVNWQPATGYTPTVAEQGPPVPAPMPPVYYQPAPQPQFPPVVEDYEPVRRRRRESSSGWVALWSVLGTLLVIVAGVLTWLGWAKNNELAQAKERITHIEGLLTNNRYGDAEREATAAIEGFPKTAAMAPLRGQAHLFRARAVAYSWVTGTRHDYSTLDRAVGDCREARRLDPELSEPSRRVESILLP